MNDYLISELSIILKSTDSSPWCSYCGNPLSILESPKYKEWLKYYKSREPDLDFQDEIPQCPLCGIYDCHNL